MTPPSPGSNITHNRLLYLVIAVIVAVIFAAFTWFSIRESRKDSYRLLVLQGKSFTESLAAACNNAVVSQNFYERLSRHRYSELVSLFADLRGRAGSGFEWRSFVDIHNVDGIAVFDTSSEMVMGGVGGSDLQTRVQNEVRKLFDVPDSHSVLLTVQESGEAPSHIYLEIASTLDEVTAITGDASLYVSAVTTTGIGPLIQRMAREEGIVYIMYQTPEGIVFSSRNVGDVLSIASDPFLSKAHEGDSIAYRQNEFQGEPCLEMVRPFSTGEFPFGIFRVGLSMRDYYKVLRGFDTQIILLAVASFALIVTGLLYAYNRQEKRQITRDFRRMKALTEGVFEHMQTGVVVIGDDGRILLANKAFQQAVEEEVREGAIWQTLKTARQIDGLGAPGASEREIVFHLTGRDSILLVAKSEVVLEGNQRATVLVLSDITTLKEYEKTAARKERLSELGELAATVAHEIRNPLNTISIAAQRLAHETADKVSEPTVLPFTQVIRDEIRRLNEIVNRFLALTKESKLSRRTVDLRKLLFELETLWRPESESLGISLLLNSEDIQVETDPDKLKAVLTNLYQNSKEALNGEAGSISCQIERRGNDVIINFEDSGPGIPDHLREKVFTPFFTSKSGGTGLGLATVQSRVEELGGRISIVPAALGGAGFAISLPAKKP